LEVRSSNAVAQNLYHKYTFKEMGVRRRYYSDNGEDALVMWTDALDSESFLAACERNERKLAEHVGSADVRLGDRAWSLSDG
jgi:ribosomal-protein-alanine N-acetyltransferase